MVRPGFGNYTAESLRQDVRNHASKLQQIEAVNKTWLDPPLGSTLLSGLDFQDFES